MSRERRPRQPRFEIRDDLLDRADATLDLHGTAAAEARVVLRSFLEGEARRAPGSVVHVITGKGKGSAGGAVLRPLVAVELRGGCSHFVADWSRDAADAGFKVRLR
jgi:DNA-nicking Smr family endonuclease